MDEAGNLVGKNDNSLLLPRFPDMVMTVVDSNQQYDSSVLLEVVINFKVVNTNIDNNIESLLLYIHI